MFKGRQDLSPYANNQTKIALQNLSPTKNNFQKNPDIEDTISYSLDETQKHNSFVSKVIFENS